MQYYITLELVVSWLRRPRSILGANPQRAPVAPSTTKGTRAHPLFPKLRTRYRGSSFISPKESSFPAFCLHGAFTEYKTLVSGYVSTIMVLLWLPNLVNVTNILVSVRAVGGRITRG